MRIGIGAVRAWSEVGTGLGGCGRDGWKHLPSEPSGCVLLNPFGSFGYKFSFSFFIIPRAQFSKAFWFLVLLSPKSLLVLPGQSLKSLLGQGLCFSPSVKVFHT